LTSRKEYRETEGLTDTPKEVLYEVKRPKGKVGHVEHLSGRWGTLAVVTGPKITPAASPRSSAGFFSMA